MVLCLLFSRDANSWSSSQTRTLKRALQTSGWLNRCMLGRASQCCSEECQASVYTLRNPLQHWLNSSVGAHSHLGMLFPQLGELRVKQAQEGVRCGAISSEASAV
eukprot:3873550-Amphidinium_carterae.1